MKENLRFPVVLCHGFLTLGNLSWQRTKIFGYFRKVRKIFDRLNVKIYEPIVPGSDRVDKRAVKLHQFIKEKVKEERVHLVCHSMGGLDGRYLASKLDLDKRIVSLSTISTPHYGTPFADWCVEKIYRPQINDILNTIGLTLEGIYDLTTEQATIFNQECKDSDSVKYFTFSTAQDMKKTIPFLRFSHWIISRRLKDSPENDGLVPEVSSHWSGFVKTLKADHLGVLGYIAMPSAKKDFSARSFYSELANLLADVEKVI